ncbi:MAG: NAD(+)/NADH kinase [Clostridia bacterium]|nr:NAD(+)/NADH kinase [Clostridia bacterium]
MNRFFFIPNPKKDDMLTCTRAAAAFLLDAGATVYMREPFAALCDVRICAVKEEELPPDAEAIITVGGDGTVLEASRIALRLGIPLLGINLGRFGYMAELEPDHISDLRKLLTDSFSLRELMTLRVTLVRQGKEWVLPRPAVNDVVFYRSSIGHMVTLGLSSVSTKNKVKYMADGLILATPIGSTAYSLSAGGPVLSSEVAAICATPICPHSFFNRSLLYSAGETLCVRNMSDEDGITVTIDGRENLYLEPQDSVIVEQSSTPFYIISFDKKDFISVLQQKMKTAE